MIWAMFFVAAAAVWSGWRVGRKMRRTAPFVIMVALTASFIVGLALSHYNIINSLQYKRALSLYCSLYLLFAVGVFTLALLWRRRLLKLLLVVIEVGVFAYGFTWGRSHLRIEKVEIHSERLPEAFNGFRIALISDLHLGSMLDQYSFTERLVEKINSLQPDIVIQCGDLVSYRNEEFDARTMAILQKLNPRYGVYSVLGNHDLGIYNSKEPSLWRKEQETIADKQLAMGWRLLNNTTQYIAIGADSIAITGLAYPAELIYHSHETLEHPIDYTPYYADIEGFNITVSHAPQVWEALMAQNIATDLTLSGHVHAMQLKLLGFTPARLFYRRPSGFYTNKRGSLYVNDGIGSTVVPLRFGATPEITIVVIN